MTSTKDNSTTEKPMSRLQALVLKYSVPPQEQEVQRLAREHFVKQQCLSPLQKKHLEETAGPGGLESLTQYSMGIHV